jgi:hypothetical protein
MKKFFLLVASASLFTMVSCTKDAGDSAALSSNETVSMNVTSEDFQFIRTAYPDNKSKWNIKMNDIAAAAYAQGLNNYPDHSVIIKEKRDSEGAITGYDVLQKVPGDKNSVEGWLWLSFDHLGTVIYDEKQKGTTCQSCHSADRKINSLY